MLCPRDFRPCIDDCCRGGRCVLSGDDTIDVCQICHMPIVPDVSGAGLCNCEWDDEIGDEMADWYYA